jgi:hypothetical protein
MKKTILLILISSIALNAQNIKKIHLPNISFEIATDKDFKVLQRNCQWCHSYGYILNQGRQSQEFWNRVIVKMRDIYKAPITKQDEKLLSDYLFKHYGDSNISK